MAILPVLRFPDEKLRTKALPVTEVNHEIRTIISNMFDTMYAENGVGLAATQVDIHQRIVVIDVSENKEHPYVLINPEIIRKSDDTLINEEGCLSVPEVYDSVERPNKLRIEALDENGEKIDEEVEGLLAVCIQHEMDHLNGVIFVDYLSRLKQTRARDKVRKVLKIREKQEAAEAQPQAATNV